MARLATASKKAPPPKPNTRLPDSLIADLERRRAGLARHMARAVVTVVRWDDSTGVPPQQEAIAKTEEPSVAYHYRAGLKGFRTNAAPRVIWRDVARGWQKYEFGGSPNTDPVALRARNRLAIVETSGGSVAVFPPVPEQWAAWPM